MSRRRKIITRVIVLMLLLGGGAIVNVAVAWGHCIRSNQHQAQSIREEFLAPRPPGQTVVITTTTQTRYGFPFTSLRTGGLRRFGFNLQDTKSSGYYLNGPRWLVGSQGVDLPNLPLWPGFAINTIFYAAILWALFFAPGSVRRTFRRRRGLCPACAYPVGTSPVCTECGKPVKKQSTISDQRSVTKNQS